MLAALAGLGVVAALLYYSLAAPPAAVEVRFARAARQTLTSTIVTNGKIEPLEFAPVRAAREGAVTRLAIEKGARVQAGQLMAVIEAPELSAEVAAAEARIAEARSELALFERGGSPAALAEIDAALQTARVELEDAKRERERTARLVEKQAETREALTGAEARIRTLESQIAGLTSRRAAQLPAGGSEAAKSRLRDAESVLALARRRIANTEVRAPIAGLVYNLPLRQGDFVRPGDLIAEIGRTARVKAVVYVDEPELGRVSPGLRVRITWDAMPGRTWDAEVEKMPVQIVPLNSRQVGEVICTLPNAGGELAPGANINAEIVSRQVAGALAIPKGALRREGAADGVLVLEQPANKLAWRAVQLGTSSVTHAEVAMGLREGDLVALPGETPLAAGVVVRPVLPN